ncbi:MAG: hypothetical protein ACTSXG_01555 [Alphaproteobacteria bacterium]
MWVVTRKINEYNQDGEYFVAAYTNKPLFQDLKKLLPDKKDAVIERLTRGGGRQRWEEEWFFLTQVNDGETLYNG